MRRREFIALMGASVAWPFATLAQEPGRTYRLGFLVLVPRDAPVNVQFLDELRRRGFVEGQNLTVEFRASGQHVDLFPQYAAELVNARVDVIAAAGEDAIRAVQQATKTIPIVAIGGDLLASGFVNSLSRPDGNTTGVSFFAFESNGKRQDILIEAVPGLRLMAVLTDVNTTSAAELDALQEAARARNIEFSIHRVAKGEEIAAAIDSAQASGATALNTVSSPLFYVYRHLIVGKNYDDELYKSYLKLTVYTAGKLAPYQDPVLATVKVGGDRDHPLVVREGVTSKQIMEELRQKILETGLLPSRIVDVTPDKVEGVDAQPQSRTDGEKRRIRSANGRTNA